MKRGGAGIILALLALDPSAQQTRVVVPPEPLRSVTIEGRDILDFPLEIGATGDVGGAMVTFTRPGTDGRYTLTALPAGDYLVAALTDLEPADLLDESFIELLIPAALAVRIGEGEKKTLDLRLVK